MGKMRNPELYGIRNICATFILKTNINIDVLAGIAARCALILKVPIHTYAFYCTQNLFAEIRDEMKAIKRKITAHISLENGRHS